MSLSGCHKNNHGPTNSNATQKVQIQSNQTISCQITTDPYSCQKQACQNAGAKYDDNKNICECSEGQIFSSKNGGVCIHIQSKLTSNFNRITFANNNFSIRNYSKTPIESILNKSSLPLILNRRILFVFDSTENVMKNDFIQSFNSPEDIMELKFPEIEISKSSGNEGISDRANSVDYAFTIVPKNRPVFIQNEEISLIINNGLQAISKNETQKINIESSNELGCAGICIEKSTFPAMNSENNTYSLDRIRVFSGGNPMKDALRVFDKKLNMYTALVVLVNELPSYGYSINAQGDLYLENLLGKKEFHIKNLFKAKPSFQKLSGVPVAIFEGFYQDHINPAVMPGKYTESHYYGYFPPHLHRPYSYGITYSMFFEDGESSINHTVDVSLIASDNLKKPILPFSLLSFRNGDFAKGLESIPAKKVVASVSLVFTRSYEYCKNGPIGKQVEQTRNNVLWTIGAANTGRRVEQPKDLPFCPQSLQGPNVMIVASTEDGVHIASSSTYGRHYADILELGCEQDKENCVNQGGTSFASPRLARKAADLMELFPELSPEQIKLALMITAKPKLKYSEVGFLERFNLDIKNLANRSIEFYDVRSGGIVDFQAANTFLRYLKSKKALSLLTNTETLSTDVMESLLASKANQYKEILSGFKWPLTNSTKRSFLEELVKQQINFINGGVK